jgi:hypothetical protein
MTDTNGVISFSGMGKPQGCKLIRVSGEVSGSPAVIRRISIRGDFFAVPEEAFERAESRLEGVGPDEIGPALGRLLDEEGVSVAGLTAEGVAEVVREAVDAASL